MAHDPFRLAGCTTSARMDAAWLSRPAPPPLDVFIARLWTHTRPAGLAHAREWGLPSGHADLVVPLDRLHVQRYADAQDGHGSRLAGGVLQGAMRRPTLRDTSQPSVVVGAHFRAAGLCALWPGPADALAGQTLALDALWPGWSDRLRDRIHQTGALHQPLRRLELLAQALRERLLHTAPPDTMVLWALERLHLGQPVGAVQRASGWAPASFIRRFRAACGLTPQQYLAVRRFQQAQHAGHAGMAWGDAAQAAGYADQAHLVREYRRHAGLPPGQARRAATGWAAHLACA